MRRTFLSRSPEETHAFAAELAEELAPNTVIALEGDLGAGKTCFVQGLALGLGIDEPVTSPSYTLVNEYRGGRLPLFHIDLYRLGGPEEVLGLGLEEYFEAGGVTAVEWPSRAGDLLPPDLLCVRLEHAGENERRITVSRKEKE